MILACIASAQTVVVGSKKFTESYVLGEIAKKVIADAGLLVDHKQGMGNTSIVWGALSGGSIDAYAEYTGTLAEEILKKPGLSLEEIRAQLDLQGIGVSGELGFNNTYALVMKRSRAAELGITKISDLKNHPELKAGPTHEFLDRADGWKKVMANYGIELADVKGIEHGLGYSGLNAGEIDIKDCYSTDAEIAKYDLTVLQDDRHFFPTYMAVWVYRKTLDPKAVKALESVVGTIDEGFMSRLNERADETKDYSAAAAMYFSEVSGKQVKVEQESLTQKILGWTLEHLYLVGISLLLAVLFGVPLGIIASHPGRLSGFILGGTGVIQTIPSLALLALLVPIPFFGITERTAIMALFLYSLLPIVRNTAIGISTIPQPLRESAEALGLEPGACLRKVYLPLAMPTILAGIKTSAVICVGTATLAALIGAGGLGEPIISGLSLNDNATVLQGAIPAAVLAIVVQLLFDVLERAVVPRGLRKH
ncbi:MAG: glycine betaine ABC transporter substrate-binding protein [Fimbriimonas sp.]